jgi:hypothetical protein
MNSMSSVSSVSSTDRASLLAEARAEWQHRAQSRADASGSKVAQTPSDAELIAEDALLAKEIQAAQKAAEAVTEAATATAGSISVMA